MDERKPKGLYLEAFAWYRVSMRTSLAGSTDGRTVWQTAPLCAKAEPPLVVTRWERNL